jgi:YebC/PmpR family DNA-binding regulatory protein
MSGHSKWHTTKRHKAVIDARRGKVFSVLSKEISLAAKAGGGNPEANARLRTVLDKARAANMPTDNIKRAVQKGTGEIPGAIYEEFAYEGYGPGGVGLVVEVTTDNKNRAAGEVRHTFSDNGGNMAQAGAVTHGFHRKGQVLLSAAAIGEDALMELALARQAGEGQQTKMELVYQYLTGHRFRQRVTAIIEKFEEMHADLAKERTTMTKLWAKREMQIQAVLAATAGMYGDLQGIAGQAIETIEALDVSKLTAQ